MSGVDLVGLDAKHAMSSREGAHVSVVGNEAPMGSVVNGLLLAPLALRSSLLRNNEKIRPKSEKFNPPASRKRA
jgi:hypothetical protein